jgi:hypothetical protein
MPANIVTGLRGWGWREERLLAPALPTRILAQLLSNSLDRRLAAGEDSTASALLAARATQLGRRGTRLGVARGLERAAFAWEQPIRRFGILPARGAVTANRLALLELIAQLRQSRVVYVRGVAAARMMLVDGTGPMYTDRRGEALAGELRWVRALLQG